MPTRPILRLATPLPTGTARLRLEERRRRPVAGGRRARVVVLGPQGAAALDPDDVRRLAQLADVTFRRLDEAAGPAATARALRGTDVLVVIGQHRPALDERLLASVPTLRGVVLAGSGIAGVDVRRLQARRVGLVVVPERATRAVAAHAMALLCGLRSARHAPDRRPLLAG